MLAGGRLVTPHGVLDPGWLEVAGERLVGLGAGVPTGRADLELAGRWVIPGFVDMHVHGGGGRSFQTASPDDAAAIVAFHRNHGTTTMMASLVTASVPILERAVAGLADLVDDGLLAGLHLEGPWLSRRYCGAHDARLLRAPDDGSLDALLAVRPGAVGMVTLAPELPGGVEAVRGILDAGAVAAIGHTAASYDQVRAAVAAGATVGTHLFNAMPPFHHREPGPVGALLEQADVTVELVVDGMHLHPAVVQHVLVAAGAARVALVTDAMAAAGCGDGTYRLGGLAVTVTGGVARVDDTGAIAGSTLTCDAAFRRAIQECGASVVDAARMSSGTPAAALGLADRGALATGLRADLVVLDADLRVSAVMVGGAWVDGTGPEPRWEEER